MRRMKKALTIYLAIILLISTFLIINPINCVKAETLNVGAGQTYSTIQSAINDASENDTIYVHSGTYNEIITISLCKKFAISTKKKSKKSFDAK